MEHKKVNFLHSVRLKMLLAMAFFAFVTGGFACALFISSTKEEIGSVTRGYMRHLLAAAVPGSLRYRRHFRTRHGAIPDRHGRFAALVGEGDVDASFYHSF